MIEIYSRMKDNVVVITLVGDLDVNSSELIEVVGWHVRNGRVDILCDFTNVNLIDHQGISALIIAYKNVKNHNGRLKLCCLPGHIRKLLNSVCLDAYLEIHESLENALVSFQEDKAISEIKSRPLRRRFDRIILDLPVEFRVRSSRSAQFHAGKVFDLSGVGAFIFSEKTFAVGENLILRFRLPPRKNLLEIDGKVLWLSDKDTQPQLYPGMGVEFTRLSALKQGRILRFVERNAASRKSA